MITKLSQLYNTLLLVETKGASTKVMGDCLKYLEQTISDLQKEEEAKAKDEKAESAKEE